VTAWVESHAHEIELVYPPSYAPDHDPSEHLNNDLKQQLRQQPQPDTKEELVERTRRAGSGNLDRGDEWSFCLRACSKANGLICMAF
jgi:hypothetical protein